MSEYRSMRYLRVWFRFEGSEVQQTFGPFTGYWATIWLDQLRLQHEIAGYPVRIERAILVAEGDL